jgi:hypothetical protein
MTQVTRRDFGKYVGAGALALGIGEITMGLSCNNITQDVLTAFNAIVGILGGAGIIPGGPIVSVVSLALQDVIVDVVAYNAAPSVDKTTTGLKLALAIQLAQAQLQTFYSGLNLTGTLAIVVEGGINIILSTLAGFLPVLPILPIPSPALKVAMTLPKQIVYVPMKRTARQFRSDFNKVFINNNYPKVF